MAPRVPVPLREIVYTLSPYQQEIIGSAITKIPRKVAHFVQERGVGLAIMGSVLFGPIWYADWYKEHEKIEDRY